MEHNEPVYNILELAKKWQEGTISMEEKAYYEKWYSSFDDSDLVLTENPISRNEELSERIYDKLNARIAADHAGQHIAKRLYYRIAVAASVVFCLSFGTYYLMKSNKVAKETLAAVNDIKPGGNKAFLTLADGKRILLTDAANGKLAKEEGIQITKTADGQIVYEVIKTDRLAEHKNRTAYNTIETPRGGQYQVLLPDGSKVWLNAASKLIYPVSFHGLGERKVELSGEAYFEVAKDKSHPFKVKSSGQEVEVLGTHFNINAYREEGLPRTTLLEGAVQISGNNGNKALLKPGEQAALKGNDIHISKVDIEEAVAWKNGYFFFENADLETVMKQLSRWYDVDIVYPKKINERFYAQIPSKSSLSEVLKVLELTGKVHFAILGGKIIVNP